MNFDFSDWRKDLFLIGFIMTLTLCFTAFLTFLFAFFHGNQVLVEINYFGEGNFELFMILLSVPGMIYFNYLSFQKIFEDRI